MIKYQNQDHPEKTKEFGENVSVTIKNGKIKINYVKKEKIWKKLMKFYSHKK